MTEQYPGTSGSPQPNLAHLAMTPLPEVEENPAPLRDLDLDRHVKSLTHACPEDAVVYVADKLEFLAASTNTEFEGQRTLLEALQSNHDGRDMRTFKFRGNSFLAMPVTNHLQATVGWVLIFSNSIPAIPQTQRAHIEELASNICVELALTDELNMMADELSERYEELNLVYATSDEVDRETNDEEVLQSVTENIVDFLNFDFALVSIPEKHIWVWHCEKDFNSDTAEHLLHMNESLMLDLLREHQQALVINEPEDHNTFPIVQGLPVRAMMTPIRSDDDQIIGALTIIRGYNHSRITTSDKSLLYAMASRVAQTVKYNYDPITGLPNQDKFERLVNGQIEAMQRRTSHCLLYASLKDLDYIQEQYGARFAEGLRIKLANSISNICRESDMIGSMNDAGVSLFFINCNPEEIALKATNFCQGFARQTFMLRNQQIRPRVTAGITEIRTGTKDTAAEFIQQATIANRLVAESNTKHVQVFSPTDKQVMDHRSSGRILTALNNALEQNLFELYAQSISSLSVDDKAPHFEVLLRLRDSENNFLSPVEFIPVGEKHRLMPDIDYWVIQNALKIMRDTDMAKRFPGTVCSINLSGQSFSVPHFSKKIAKAISNAGVDPASICLEITETAAIADITQARDFILELKNIGCKFALDDFGAGLSSFSYLRALPLDYVKIDGSFVKDLLEDEVAGSMVRAIHNIGKAMGLETVAEYVENAELARTLRDIGVHYGQGYGIDKPTPLKEYLDIWAQGRANNGRTLASQ